MIRYIALIVVTICLLFVGLSLSFQDRTDTIEGFGIFKRIRNARKRARQRYMRNYNKRLQAKLQEIARNPPINPSLIAKMKKDLKEIDGYQSQLKFQDSLLTSNLVYNANTSENMRHDIDIYYDKTMCERAHVYEHMDLTNTSNAVVTDNDLYITRSMTHGVWDSNNNKCLKPEYNNDKCVAYSVECAYPGTLDTYVVNGIDDPDNKSRCIFPYCPIYCEKYDGDCWDLVPNSNNMLEFNSNMGRFNCVKEKTENEEEEICMYPDVKFCPEKTEYYYATDNITIMSNLKTPYLESNVCMYESLHDESVAVFQTLSEAMSNCVGAPLTHECYVHNQEFDVFTHQSYPLNRKICGFSNVAPDCVEEEHLECTFTTPVYQPINGVHSMDGIYAMQYRTSNLSKALELRGKDMHCITNSESGWYTADEVQASCTYDRCFGADGSDATSKTGIYDAISNTCSIEDCFATSRAISIADCDARTFYYLSNNEIRDTTYDISIVGNQCTYSTPYTGTIYNSRQEAEATCVGMADTKTCFYNDGFDAYERIDHTLDRSTCSYNELPNCYDEAAVQAVQCPNSYNVYKMMDKTYQSGIVTIPIDTVSVRDIMTLNNDRYTCQRDPVIPDQYASSLLNACSNMCYTPWSGSNQMLRMGVIENNQCTINNCFESMIDAGSPGSTPGSPPGSSPGSTPGSTPDSYDDVSGHNPVSNGNVPGEYDETTGLNKQVDANGNESYYDPISGEIYEQHSATEYRRWNAATNSYEYVNIQTGERRYTSSDGTPIPYNSTTGLIQDPTDPARFVDPKTNTVYVYDPVSGTYQSVNTDSGITKTISEDGTVSYENSRTGETYDNLGIFVDSQGNVHTVNPVTGLIQYVDENGVMVYIHPITKARGVFKNGIIQFPSADGSGVFYYNMSTSVVSSTIELTLRAPNTFDSVNTI